MSLQRTLLTCSVLAAACADVHEQSAGSTASVRVEERELDEPAFVDAQTELVSQPACAAEAIAAAHARALAAASATGCATDADCVLTNKHAPCVYKCEVAIPSSALSTYEQLLTHDVFPLCAPEENVDCQNPPPLCCAPVKAVCEQGTCQAIPSEQ